MRSVAAVPQDAVPEVDQAAAAASSTVEPVAAPHATPGNSGQRIKHDFYQSDAYVMVSVMIKGLAPDDVECAFEERSLSVTARLHTGADYK